MIEVEVGVKVMNEKLKTCENENVDHKLHEDCGLREEIWTCTIGGMINSHIRPGGDAPMRQAVQKAYYELTGIEEEFCFSGWGCELTDSQREVVKNNNK